MAKKSVGEKSVGEESLGEKYMVELPVAEKVNEKYFSETTV